MVVVICFWWGLFSWLYYDSFVLDWLTTGVFYFKYFTCSNFDFLCTSANTVSYRGLNDEIHLFLGIITAIPFIYVSYANQEG